MCLQKERDSFQNNAFPVGDVVIPGYLRVEELGIGHCSSYCRG